MEGSLDVEAMGFEKGMMLLLLLLMDSFESFR